MEEVRKIIREELYRMMQEIGQEDPVKLSQNMIRSNEEQIKELENELRYRQADARVQGLPREEKKAREEMAKSVINKLEISKKELEMAKQAQITAVQMQTQSQSSEQIQTSDQTQIQGQSQIQPQT